MADDELVFGWRTAAEVAGCSIRHVRQLAAERGLVAGRREDGAVELRRADLVAIAAARPPIARVEAPNALRPPIAAEPAAEQRDGVVWGAAPEANAELLSRVEEIESRLKVRTISGELTERLGAIERRLRAVELGQRVLAAVLSRLGAVERAVAGLPRALAPIPLPCVGCGSPLHVPAVCPLCSSPRAGVDMG
jgi:hypothetical protein